MESSGAPFMTPLVCGPCSKLRGDGGAWRSIPLVGFMAIVSLHREVYPPPQVQGKSVMAGSCPLFQEVSTESGNFSQCRHGCNPGGTGKEVEEVRPVGTRAVNPGEWWFNLQTTPAERRALFCLEREIDATLMFEHGGGQKTGQLWVT